MDFESRAAQRHHLSDINLVVRLYLKVRASPAHWRQLFLARIALVNIFSSAGAGTNRCLSRLSTLVLIEGNSHFNHLFTFPRFAALNRGGEEKAFVPYTHIFGDACGQILRARALSVAPTEKARGVITLDREVELDGKRSTQIPHDFLVVATGTKLQPPGTLPGETKVEGVKALQDLQDKIRDASKIVLVGGGAVGVQVRKCCCT